MIEGMYINDKVVDTFRHEYVLIIVESGVVHYYIFFMILACDGCTLSVLVLSMFQLFLIPLIFPLFAIDSTVVIVTCCLRYSPPLEFVYDPYLCNFLFCNV